MYQSNMYTLIKHFLCIQRMYLYSNKKAVLQHNFHGQSLCAIYGGFHHAAGPSR
jgi:hypothetical protein